MPLLFRDVCDLLQRLEDDFKAGRKTARSAVTSWFQDHRAHLDAPECDASAVLSTLLPELRTDRVYRLQPPRLQSILGRALGLGHSRVLELRRHATPGSGVDLGDCVQGVLNKTPNHASAVDRLTVEEIDSVLNELAAACPFSSPAIRRTRRDFDDRYADRALGDVYTRLSARDAKWMTRLVLKNFEPVTLNQQHTLRCYHGLLPQLLKVRDDLSVVTAFLRHVKGSPSDHARIASALKPELGIKVGRQEWLKGRSIKHCLDMGRRRDVSCEEKVDGEYCQIHIDRSRGSHCIQIFSKSGKDSTQDRKGLHKAIQDSLRLGQRDCPIKKGCILEGELVVYSDKDHKILPFHKIRKHVSRSGRLIGADKDSQPHEHEHLMIIYFDMLMLDDESLLGVRHSERRKRLSSLVRCRKGRAELVQREVISLSSRTAAKQLRDVFAQCILNRGEGLVLKPDSPYFDFTASRLPFEGCAIKLKKSYLQGWGDIGDFAVVAAAYEAAKAKTYSIPNLQWTHFYIGCIQNRNDVRERDARPRFKIVNVVELNDAMLRTFRSHCNTLSTPVGEAIPFEIDFKSLGSVKPPSCVFQEPPVFDIRCFSFDKESNSDFWSMRFPMVSKIHFDRTFMDTIPYSQLQEAAIEATEAPDLEDSQQMRDWVAALERADPGGIPIDQFSQSTVTSEGLCSPRVFRRSNSERRSTTDKPQESRMIEKTTSSPHCPGTNTIDLLTPPRSSAVVEIPSDPPNGKESGGAEERTPTKRSRDAASGLPSAKKIRSSPKSTKADAPVRSSDKRHPQQPPNTRQPLAQVNPNSFNSDPASQGRGIGVPDPVPVAALKVSSAYTQEEVELLGISTSSKSRHVSQREPPLTTGEVEELRTLTPSPICTPAGCQCPLLNRSVLLSPCIATYPWVTDTLLSQHGIDGHVADPLAWKQQSKQPAAVPNGALPGASSAPDRTQVHAQAPVSARARSRPPRPAPRARKICLVESRRKEATEAFVQRIDEAGLRRRSGKREWVAVYDWRVLEALAAGPSSSGRQIKEGERGEGDPWRRYYVGIA